VALPYKDGTLAGYATLPKQGAAAAGGGSSAAAGALAGVQLAELLNQQHWSTPPEVSVALPKFKVTNQNTLTSCLTALGMQAALDPASADLSRLSSTPLYVSDVVQSVVVEVDEQGTTAAAATAAVRCVLGGGQGVLGLAGAPCCIHTSPTCSHTCLPTCSVTKGSSSCSLGRRMLSDCRRRRKLSATRPLRASRRLPGPCTSGMLLL